MFAHQQRPHCVLSFHQPDSGHFPTAVTLQSLTVNRAKKRQHNRKPHAHSRTLVIISSLLIPTTSLQPLTPPQFTASPPCVPQSLSSPYSLR